MLCTCSSLAVSFIKHPSFTTISKKKMADENGMKTFLYIDHFSIENTTRMSISHLSCMLHWLVEVAGVSPCFLMHEFGQAIVLDFMNLHEITRVNY